MLALTAAQRNMLHESLDATATTPTYRTGTADYEGP
jgi:hypothetical protein